MRAGSTLYSFVCTFTGFSPLLGFVLENYCASFISAETFYFISGGASGVSLIILWFFFDMDPLGLEKKKAKMSKAINYDDDDDEVTTLSFLSDTKDTSRNTTVNS